MRLYDSMTLGWHIHFMKSIYASWDDAYSQLLLKRFGLNAEQKVKGLSHGQRVKAYLLLHPDAKVSEVADALAISVSTANKWMSRMKA